MAGFWRSLLRLRDKTAAEIQAQQYFNEIGANDPFTLAKHLGVKILYDQLGHVVGKYSPFPDHHIYINERSDIETQENAVFELMLHHIEHPRVKRSFTKQELLHALLKLRRHGAFWWL